MPSSLGLYVEDNIIKYAKVSKDHDKYKIESFGMKFYDKIDGVIKQIINETYSYKTPISINLLNEKYTSSELFSLLNSNDLNKAAKIEFEYYCDETHKNKNALEYRNTIAEHLEDRDKVVSVYAYTEKSDVGQRNQMLSGYRINGIIPTSMSIVNLLRPVDKKNRVIVNIESKTSVTFIVNNKIYKIEQLDVGMKQILDNIMMKENSYAKAYEICKNTTIYTSQGRNLQIEENEYMEDIMPTLYKIVEGVRDIVIKSGLLIDEIYITGLASSINNIDLYFQENFVDKKCEILTPFFIDKTNLKLNVRDYIEVNSAIALALQGLGIGFKEINFKQKGVFDRLKEISNIEIGTPKNKDKADKEEKTKEGIKLDFDTPLDSIEKNMIRGAISLFIILLMYIIVSVTIMGQINKKNKQINDYISTSKEQVAAISNNTKLINERNDQYSTLIEKINEANNKLTASYAKKNMLPNFLTEIMYNIPKEVQLKSIENVSDKKIKIEAQSKEYEQLGYFIAKIKNEGILTDVTSTAGEKQNEFVVVTIEGNLPY